MSSGPVVAGIRAMLMKLGAMVFVLCLASGTQVILAQSDAESCTDGIALRDFRENPFLIEDCALLLSIRDEISGGGRSLNWNVDTPFSEWEGVSVDGSPARVVSLQFRFNDQEEDVLQGRIPPELSRLTGLRILDFYKNDLGGEIPPELGSLLNLRVLDLTNNSLTGSIPPELGQIEGLRELDLGGNELTGEIPLEVTSLTRLRKLDLGSNRLTGEIPAELGNIEGLRWLDLGSNRLTGVIPKKLGNLDELRALHLGYNELTGEIPPELGSIRGLVYLNLWNNRLTGSIPPELGDLYNLESLTLNGNRLSGVIPGDLSRLTSLWTLWLDENQLTGRIPAELGMLPNLRSLNLSENSLEGEIPPELGGLTNMEDINLSKNQLYGEIPEELGMLIALESLSLEHNQLTGEIPETLGNLTKLSSLGLRNNQIEGEIPQFLGTLPNMWGIFLSENRLTGEIPSNLGELTELTYLELRNNRLTGDIPESLANLPNLLGLLLVGNAEIGCIPIAFARFERIRIDNPGIPFCFAVDDDPTTVSSPALLTVREGGSITIESSVLLANDLQPGIDPLRMGIIGYDFNGSVRLEGSTITYRHDGSETTTGGFTYFVRAGILESQAMVTLAVINVNDPPAAMDDYVFVEEGGVLRIEAAELFANDVDEEDDELLLVSVSHPVNGVVTLDGTAVSYSHNGSERTKGGFAYTISDGVHSSEAIVDITVEGVNDPPIVVGETAAMEIGETLRFEASSLLANDSDAENDVLRITAVGDAVNGTVSLDGATVTFRHDGSMTNDGGFSYTVSDGADSETATVSIAVSPPNRPPRAVDDSAEVEEGGRILIPPEALLNNDLDEDDDLLTVKDVTDPVNGAVSFDGTTIVFEHDGSETTVGGFTYTVGDQEMTDSAEVIIDVSAVNDPPMTTADRLRVPEGGTVSIDASELLANDVDVDSQELRVLSVGGAENGRVYMDGASIVFEHDGSESAESGFTYTVSDGSAESEGEVKVDVTPVNDPPLAVSDRLEVDEGGTLRTGTRRLLANDFDPDSNLFRVTDVGGAIGGIVRVEGADVVFEHDGSEDPNAGFTYTVSDGIAEASADVQIDVRPVNDSPTAASDNFEMERGETLFVEVSELLANHTDPEGDVLTITSVGDAVNGEVRLVGAIVSYEHDGSKTGLGSFTYSVSDGNVESVGTVSVNVTAAEGLSTTLIVGLSIGALAIVIVAAIAAMVAFRLLGSGGLREKG